jgi:hypothetical protein
MATFHDFTFQKKCIITEEAYFSKLCYHKSFQDSEVGGATVNSSSYLCTSTMLLLLIVIN